MITVDIDDRSIRILQTQGARVVRWASASLEPGVVTDGNIPEPEALGARVRSLMKLSGIKGGEVMASLSGLYSVSRALPLPAQAGPAGANSLDSLVRGAVPEEGMVLQYQVARPQQKVLVQSVPLAAVQSHLRALRSAGLDVRALELKGVALARAVGRRQALIVNVEENCLEMVLVAEGLPQVMRAQAFPQDIAQEERAGYAAQALWQAVTFYHSQEPGQPLPADVPLFLVGPGAGEASFTEALQSKLGYPVEEFAPPLERPAHLQAAQYAVNLGLALRDLPADARAKRESSPEPIAINLVPRRPPVWRPWIFSRVGVVGVIVALGLALSFPILQQVADARQETGSWQSRLTALEGQLQVRLKEIGEMNQMEAVLKSFQSLVAPQGSLTGIIALVRETAPPGVEIASLSVDASLVSMTGKAESPELAIQFVNALRALPDPRAADSLLFSVVNYTQTQTGPVSLSLNATRFKPPKK